MAPLIYRKLSVDEASKLIRGIIDQGGELSGYFDFGAVASKKKVKTFTKLLEAFHTITGIDIDTQIFKMKREDNEPFPNFNCFPTVTDTQDMLVVEYYFSMDLEKLVKKPVNAISNVSTSTMHFTFF